MKTMEKVHDKYGKDLLYKITGFLLSTKVDYGSNARGANIDFTAGNTIAVEVEARVDKQVRGALVDLVFHEYPKKLIIVMDVNLKGDNSKSIEQYKYILNGLNVAEEDFRVVLLKGNGHHPAESQDEAIIRNALRELGFDTSV